MKRLLLVPLVMATAVTGCSRPPLQSRLLDTTQIAATTTNAVQRGHEAQIADRGKGGAETLRMVLRLDIATEDEKPVKVKIEVKQSKPEERVLLQTVSDVLPGLTEVAISGASDGDYYVYFASPGYSPQFRYFTVEKGKIEKPERKVTLFRKRYVVLHYAFNMRGGREFSGKNVEEGRAAVSQWGTLPYFGEDWQIWQKSLDGAMFGDTPFLEFHRHATGFGFAEAPKGVPFDELKEAPVDTKYKCENKRAKAGLTLFCRVEGNNDEGLGYGKLLVEDVTETPPPGIKVIEYK